MYRNRALPPEGAARPRRGSLRRPRLDGLLSIAMRLVRKGARYLDRGRYWLSEARSGQRSQAEAGTARFHTSVSDAERAAGMLHGRDYLPGSYGYGGEYRAIEELRLQRAPPAPGGSQRGRGPIGHVRPDTRILEDINERLCEDPAVDARGLLVHCRQGRVILEGQVPTRPMRHRAGVIASSVAGVRGIDNRLCIAAAPSVAEPAAASGGSPAVD